MYPDGQEQHAELEVFEEPPPLSYAADDDHTVQYVHYLALGTDDDEVDAPQSHQEVDDNSHAEACFVHEALAKDMVVDAHVANTAALDDDDDNCNCAKLVHDEVVVPFSPHAGHNYPHDLPDLAP